MRKWISHKIMTLCQLPLLSKSTTNIHREIFPGIVNPFEFVFRLINNMASKGKKTQEQIVAGFQELRQSQRNVASKINEIEMDIKEHELVIDTLKEVEGDRKCFRMVGGVLVERTVKDVLPALANNREQMGKIKEQLTKQLEVKGQEINKYREQHNLKIKGEENKDLEKSEKDVKAGGVLVAKDG